MGRVARSIRVTGRVQGVFYRAWTAREADRLGVAGCVRNCPDGSVEAHLEGDEPVVDELIARMRSGPDGALVADLRCDDASVANLDAFEVRH